MHSMQKTLPTLPVALATLQPDQPFQLAVDEGRPPMVFPTFLRTDTQSTIVTPPIEGILRKTLSVIDPQTQTHCFLALKSRDFVLQDGHLSAVSISAYLLHIMATAAAYCVLDSLDENYHAGEVDASSGINVANTISSLLEHQLCIPMEADTGDDESVQAWASLMHRCIDRERAELAIELVLQLLQPLLPEQGKLFLSIPYITSIEHWLTLGGNGAGIASTVVLWTEGGLRQAPLIAGADASLWNFNKVADELPLLSALHISEDPGRQSIVRIR